MPWPTIGWIDVTMLGVVAISALLGAWRGLTLELLSLAGWFAAWFASVWLGPIAAPYLPIGEPGSALNQVAALASVFMVVLVLWSLAARAVARFVKATPLRLADRLLGAGFGVLRGVLFLLLLAFAVAMTPLAQTEAWKTSYIAGWLSSLLVEIVPLVLPATAPDTIET